MKTNRSPRPNYKPLKKELDELADKWMTLITTGEKNPEQMPKFQVPLKKIALQYKQSFEIYDNLVKTHRDQKEKGICNWYCFDLVIMEGFLGDKENFIYPKTENTPVALVEELRIKLLTKTQFLEIVKNCNWSITKFTKRTMKEIPEIESQIKFFCHEENLNYQEFLTIDFLARLELIKEHFNF